MIQFKLNTPEYTTQEREVFEGYESLVKTSIINLEAGQINEIGINTLIEDFKFNVQKEGIPTGILKTKEILELNAELSKKINECSEELWRKLSK